jgi:hypothetical protein
MINSLVHLTKHSGGDCLGLVLGDDYSTCLPLFHSDAMTLPLIRTAMVMVERVQGDKSITGVYITSELPVYLFLINEIQNKTNRKLKIFKFNPEAALNKPFSIESYQDGSLKHTSEILELGIDWDKFKAICKSDQYATKFNDLEDHLSDGSEWTINSL